MNFFTLAQKQYLETQAVIGVKILYVAYDPTTEVGTPEADTVAAGYTQYYREDTAHLVEVIYTK